MGAVAEGILVPVVVVRDRVLVLDLRKASRHRRCGAVDAGGPVGERLFQHADVALHALLAEPIEERVVRLHHAGVDDRDADPGAVQPAVGGLRAVGADVARQCAGDGEFLFLAGVYRAEREEPIGRVDGRRGDREAEGVFSFQRHIGEHLYIAGRCIGKLAAGLAARLQRDAAHHFAPAAVLRQTIDQ